MPKPVSFCAARGAHLRLAPIATLAVLLAACSSTEPESSQPTSATTTALQEEVIVEAIGDAYIQGNVPDTNRGAIAALIVRDLGPYRTLLFFDPTEIQDTLAGATLVSAQLEIGIETDPLDWNADGDHLGVYTLDVASSELGATWSCAIDSDTGNTAPDCAGATAWSMASTDPAVTPWDDTPIDTVPIVDYQSGDVVLDVTAAVAAIADGSDPGHGFLLKKTDESLGGRIRLRPREKTPAPLLRIVRDVPDDGGMDGGMDGGTGCTPTGADDDCDGLDQDCDSAADEHHVGAATSCGTGVCASTGVMECVGGSEVDGCNPGAATGSDDDCNALDEDCDGSADEGYASASTSCGVGACAASGASSCVGGAVQDSCTPGAPAADDATCDGVDDDCDGVSDEDHTGTASTCGLGVCAAEGTVTCTAGAEVDSCQPGAGATTDAVCVGLDDDCDGATDEDRVTAPPGDPCELPFAATLTLNESRGDDSTLLGAPDLIGGALDGDNTAIYSGFELIDGAGGDFNLYVTDADFADHAVEVSEDGVSYVDITASAAAGVSLPGDEGNNDPANVQSYDLAGSGLTVARHVRVIGTGTFNGFLLDAIGVIHQDTSDLDGDLLELCAEASFGTDPADPDTDGDGLSDGEEAYNTGTDPLLADTDGDGTGDAEQVAGACLCLDPAGVDASCDGLDDDCDGSIDEDFVASCDASGFNTCVAGVPTLDPTDDGDPCTVDTCDAVTGVSHAVQEGLACDDGDVCTTGDACDAAGACQPGAAIDVDDSDPCTLDLCDPITGEDHPPAAAGTACADGDACNGDETCDGAGACVSGTAPAVDDENPCTIDGCDPDSGVFHTPDVGLACDDGNSCTTGDACDAAGQCGDADDVVVDDGDPCTIDRCDDDDGVVHLRNPGASCGTDGTCDAAGACSETRCDDGIDNDQDGLTDCGDSDCPSCANVAPVLTPIGNRGVSVGNTLFIQLSASDADGDTLSYGVTPVPLPEGASFDSSQGLLTFTPTEQQAGDYTLTFSVSDGELSASETITATVAVPTPGMAPSISGVLYDATDAELGLSMPVIGATVTDQETGTTTVTGSDGAFLLENLTPGEHHLSFDGSTATGPNSYASYLASYELIDGVAHVIDRPIFMPRLDSAVSVVVDPATTTTLDNTVIDVQLEIPPDTVFDENGDAYTGSLSLSEVPPEFTPGALPDTLDPSMVVTIQPMGLTFEEPAPVTFPNTDGLAPGSVVDIWSMDHELGEFFVAGQGQVSADGTEIVTIEGGVREASWHFVAPTGTESLAGDSSQQSTCGMASQVGLADGCLEVDIQTPTYRSLGQERGVRLVYSSRRTRSLGRTVPLRVATRIGVAGGPVPDSLGYRVNVDGIWYDGEASINLDGFTSADEIEVSLDVPMEDRPSGTYEAEVEIDNTYGETRVKNRIETVFAHYNGAESPFAIGWGVDGLQRVLIGDEPDTFWGATVLDGNGDSSIFVVAAGDPLVELSGEIARRLVPPGAAHIDDADTNQRLSFVPERADFELSADVAVDLSAPGTATFDVSTHQPGTLEQGTRVSTYLVRDPTSMRDSAGNGITVMLSADATFRRRILGIQLTDATLEAHDAELGAPGLDYSTTLDRGMEDGDGESVTWHGDGRVSFELMSSATDQVRVIVEAIEGDAFPMFAFDFNSPNAPDREWNQITTTTSASTGSIVAPAYEYLDCGDSAMHCPANSRDRVLNMDGGEIPSIGVPDVLAHMVTDRVMQFEPGFYTLSAWVGTSGATTGQRERVYSAGNNAKVWLQDVDTGADLALPTGWTGFSDFLGIIPEGGYEVRVFNVTGSGSGALHMQAGALVLDPASDGFGLLVDDLVLYRGVKFDGPPGDYSTLVRNEDDSFTRSYRDGSRVEFGSDGYQTAVVDRHGRTTRYLYISESDRRLQWIEDPAGRVTTFSYDEDGNGNSTLSHITGPDGRATHFTVESSGALTSVVFEDGTTRTFQYGAEAGPLYMVGETNQRGELKTRRYTDRGVFESAQFHDGPVEVSDPVERRMTLGIVSGLMLPSTGEFIEVDWSAFDKNTHETIIVDGEGNATRVLTNLRGAAAMTRAADGSVSFHNRDEDGNVEESIAASGHQVTRTFDAHGNVLTERDHVLMEPGEATASTYGPYDQIATVTDARGNLTRFDYDPRGNLSGITSPAGRQVSFEYYQGVGDPDDPDPALTGLLKRHTDRFGTTTTWEYESDTAVDANMNVRRIVSTNGAETRAVTFAPGPYGRVASVTDDLSRTVSFGYDAMGRVDTQTNADSSVIGFGYDPVGLLSSVAPPGQPEHSMSYDQRGRLQSYAPPAPDAGQAAEDYDSEYLLAAETLDRVNLPGGRFIDYAFEPGKGRLQSIQLQSRVGTYEIEYHQPMVDGVVKQTGLVRQVSTPEGMRLVNGYEHPDPVTGEPVPSSLLTSQTWLDATGSEIGDVSWTFDADGRLASRSVGGAWTIDYGYDEDGLLLSVDAMSLTLDEDSGYLTGTELIGVTTTADATSFGELDTFTATVNSDLVWSIDHDYDVTGQLDVKTEMLYGVTASYDYDYDLQGRLEAVSVDGVEVRRYVYDDNGNRLEMLENGAAPGTGTAGTYDDQDRLLSYGDLTFGYNAEGQLETKSDAGAGETTSYVSDELGNLMQVTLPGGSVIDYEIDGQNRRVGKLVDGVVQWRLLYGDQLNPVARLDPAGNVEQVYVYGTRPHVPDYVMTADGGVYRVLSDHLGSVRVVVDAVSGVPVQWVDYDEFGNVLSDSSPGFQPFGFAGGLYDADTGLTRFGARDYDPVVGRWTSKDPIGFGGGDTNVYAYVGNDPVNSLDPTGTILQGAILGGLGGAALGGAIGFAMNGVEGAKVGALIGGGTGLAIGGGAAFVGQAAVSAGVTGAGLIGAQAVGGAIGGAVGNSVSQAAANILLDARVSVGSFVASVFGGAFSGVGGGLLSAAGAKEAPSAAATALSSHSTELFIGLCVDEALRDRPGSEAQP